MKRLKIKDDIPLNTLEKYSFIFNNENGKWENGKWEKGDAGKWTKEMITCNSWDKILKIYTDNFLLSYESLCTLFELISDGLIEKIEVTR